MKIKIIYDGGYPNLCSGNLTAIVDGDTYVFPRYCLSSGGRVWFDSSWSDHVESGEWTISKYPEDMPESIRQAVEDAVNEQIPHGCCGGCV